MNKNHRQFNKKGIWWQMKSRIAKSLRILRIQNDENLKEMAENLGISTPYLSAIENGKRDIPSDFHEKIVNIYNLTDEESEKLKKDIELSAKEKIIDMTNLSEERKMLSIRYARKIQELSDEDFEKLKNILGEDI